MLKKLRIQNFKVWEDTGEIDLAPITLFFGANSSGKSSIGQFLMMLKQTVESRGRDVFYLGDRNSAVQLGSYQEMVFQRDVERDIKFEYQWSSNDESPIIKFTSTSSMSDRDKTFSGNDLAFQAKVGRSPVTHLPRVELFNYELIENGESQLSFQMERRPRLDSYETKSDDLTLKMRRRFTTQLPYDVPDHFYRFPRTLITRCQDAEILREFNYKHEELFSALFYLGPLRSKAERSYLHTGGAPESVGYEGEDTVAAILAARAKDKIYEKKENRFERRIASKLREIGLIEDFKVEKLVDRLYKVLVRTKGSITWVELPDIGFGISQVLPVLVQCDYAIRGEGSVKDNFFKFPTTPHLALLGDVDIRGDKVMSEPERDEFLGHKLVVEEKVDGANLGISFDSYGNIHAQNRGAYLSLPGLGQWKKLSEWLFPKEDILFDHLIDRYILFGEWCYAQHSVFYDRLPDWFLGFDIYDKQVGHFLSTDKRDAFFREIGISKVPGIAHGHFTFSDLKKFLSFSKLGDQLAEGLYLRFDQDNRLVQRTKLVRPDFIQSIEQHWSRSGFKKNRVIWESYTTPFKSVVI